MNKMFNWLIAYVGIFLFLFCLMTTVIYSFNVSLLSIFLLMIVQNIYVLASLIWVKMKKFNIIKYRQFKNWVLEYILTLLIPFVIMWIFIPDQIFIDIFVAYGLQWLFVTINLILKLIVVLIDQMNMKLYLKFSLWIIGYASFTFLFNFVVEMVVPGNNDKVVFFWQFIGQWLYILGSLALYLPELLNKTREYVKDEA